MEALRYNNFNNLLKGKSRGRGKNIVTSDSVLNSPAQLASQKTCDKDVNSNIANVKSAFICHQAKIDLENEKNKKNINHSDIIIQNNFNKNQIQFDDIDHDLCKVCDRPDTALFCSSCGHSWKVIF